MGLTVRYTRAAAWWKAEVPGAGIKIAGRSLSQARRHVRMMLARRGLEGAALVEAVQVPGALERALEQVRKARRAAAKAAAAEQEATAQAVEALLGRGQFSVRDAADLLELGRWQVCELAGRRRT